MTRWSHSKADVRDALDDAEAEAFVVMPTPDNHGHSWGYIDCPKCDQRFYVNSTPKSPTSHAKRIRQFIRRHQHPQDGEGR
jgi:hypothetical protein